MKKSITAFATLLLTMQFSAVKANVIVPDWVVANGSRISINTFTGGPNNYITKDITSLGQTSLTGTTIVGPASVTVDVELSPTPSVSLTTTGRGSIGTVELLYFFQVVGPSGAVPISVNASGSTSPLGAGEDAFIVQGAGLFIGSPTQGAWTIDQKGNFVANTIYQVSLQVGASEGGSAYIDPTFTIDPAYVGDYSLEFSAGIASAVPGPVVGAGFPGILMALGVLLAWRRNQAAIA